MSTKSVFLILNVFASYVLLAQTENNPPVPVEIMPGTSRFYVQTVISRPVEGKFEFFSLMSGAVDYKNTLSENETVVTNAFSYIASRHIRISANLKLHYKKGIMPGLGAEYINRSPNWTINLKSAYLCMPYNFTENIGILEFKPQVTGKLRLYTKLQGMYTWDLSNEFHDRSFFVARLGITRTKYTFGLGTNIDWYGPQKSKKENYGVFCRMML